MPDESELIRLLHEDYTTRAQVGVIKGMDADKDKAAESTAIEKNTGQDAQVIYGNFDEYTQRRKSSLAQGLIERDNNLIQYINSHPMAANVSKDDWGALSEVSETIKNHPELGAGLGPIPNLVARALPDILDNIKSGIDQMKAAPKEVDPAAALERTQKLVEEGREASKSLTKGPLWTPEFQKKVDEALAKSAQSPQLLNLLYGALQVAGSPLIGIFQSAVSKPIEEKTGFPAEVTEGAALIAGAFFGLRGEHIAKVKGVEQAKQLNSILDDIQSSVDRGEIFLKSGEMPPVGVDHPTDLMIGMDSEQKMKILDAIMDADKKTETKELSPELYNVLTKIQHGDQNIYLRYNAARALYGDKVPTPDDGMLGWAPRIAEQMAESARTGEDIEIPLADWRARIDPEIGKILHDDLLFHDGMTLNEAKELKPGEVARTDEAAVLGLTQELDRPYKLNKVKEGVFNVADEAGSEIAQVQIAQADNGKTLVVDWKGPSDVGGLRSLLNRLKEEYPNADTITGPKVPGMAALEKAMQGSKFRVNLPFRFKESPEDVVRKAAGMEPLFDEEALTRPLEAEVKTFEPGALLPKRQYDKLIRAMDAQKDADAQRMFDNAKQEERQKQTPEWKANEARVREEVLPQIADRPDFRTSAFFRNGRFMGQDTHYLPKLDPKFLTQEQRRGLPSRFLAKDGLNPDEIAGSMGYSTGADMVNRMIEFEKAKGDLGPTEFLRKMVDQETNRRMEQQYGKLSENIAQAAREHILSKTQFDVLHEEYIRLGELAGQQLPLSQTDIKTAAGLDFSNQISSKVSVIKYTRELGRSGRATHDAYLKGDYIGAFKARQEQLHIMAKAQLAKDFEKQQESLPRNLRKFSKGVVEGVKEVVPGVANPFTEMIQKIMYQIKRPPRRSIQNLDENIAKRDEKTLREFVNAKNNIGLPEGVLEYEVDYNQNIPVPDFLMDLLPDGTTWTKDLDATTVSEFRDIDNAIRALAKMGRDEQTWTVQGVTKDREELKSKLIGYLEQLGIKKQYAPGEAPPLWQVANSKLISMEFLMSRLGGGGDPRTNPFMQTFSFPFSRAEGDFTADIQKASAKMIEIGKKYGVKRSYIRQKVDNDVFYNPQGLKKDPLTGKKEIPAGGKEWMQMTRENMRVVALNAGNPSNLRWLAEGYNTTPERITQWLDKNMTKDDWLYVQEIGNIFRDIQDGADRMTREMSDVIIEKLPLGKIQTKAAGELDGWYYPIVYDRTLQGGKPAKIDRAPPVKPMTNASWQKRRTSPQGPISLSMRPLASQVSRRLKDNNFRQVVHEASKIMLDPEFQGAVSRYYGPAYAKLFEPYLKDIAGMNGITSGAEHSMEHAVTFLLRNTISNMVGYKVGTVLKHGFTAFFQSWAEAGIFAPDFYKAASALYMTDSATRNANWDFMMRGGKVGNLDWGGSTELQRRDRHFNRTMGGATEEQLGKMNLVEALAYRASKPVAWSDMFSSTLLWHAKYQKALKEGQLKNLSIERAHTEAVDLADYAVRRTHGSTAITAKPEAMRSQSAFIRSFTSLYGFFNHIYNRYYESAWIAKGLPEKMRKGDATYKQDIRDLTSNFMFYAVVPGIIEEVVASWYLQSEKEEEEYTPWTFFRNGLIHTTAGTVPYVRDIVNAVQTGHDPSTGILSGKAVTDLVRDLNPEKLVERPGNAIHHGLNLLHIATGIGLPDQVNRWLGFVADSMAGAEDPSTMTPEEWYRAIRTGKSEKPKHR